jgi:hypothetical protein
VAVLVGHSSSGFLVAWASRASAVGSADEAVAATDEWGRVRGNGQHVGVQWMGGCGVVAGWFRLMGSGR